MSLLTVMPTFSVRPEICTAAIFLFPILLLLNFVFLQKIFHSFFPHS